MGQKDFEICDIYAARIAALRPLPEETVKSLRNYYRVGLTYTSNALEGNSLTESETKVVIEDGLTIGGKPLRDVYEATGHARAYDFLYTLLKGTPITEDVILKLHHFFYSQIDATHAGQWRTVRVFISGSHRALPTPERVPGLMHEFIQWFVNNEGRLHPVEFAALVHQKFVYIHPFVDGNGRVARLLMNLALLRAGWTLAIIPPICRHEYIATLEQAGKKTKPFILFIRDRICETQKELLRLMGESILIEKTNAKVNSKTPLKVDVDEYNTLYNVIQKNPGLKTKELAVFLGKSIPTTSRQIKQLKEQGKIAFLGAPKTGGYYVTDNA